MALSFYGIEITEKELYAKVVSDYGVNFKNIWNSTIAKLACEFGVKTIMHADWPLFRSDVIEKAAAEYFNNPLQLDVTKYENPHDEVKLPEPLPLSYKEMFLAIKAGSKTEFGALTTDKICSLLKTGCLIQTSVNLSKLYDGKTGYHSILIYDVQDSLFIYHDPSYGKALVVTKERLSRSINGVGAGIVYGKMIKTLYNN